ncbi:MAG: LysM peptidoglycan-binding domain-containing protein [Myxococcota bacterium]
MFFLHRPCGLVSAAKALLLVAVTGLFLALVRPVCAKPRVHVVARGHTLSAIANRYGVSVDALRRANGLRRGKVLKPGMKLQIPSRNGRKPKSKRAPKRLAAGAKWHRVRKGQRLELIAREHGTTVRALCRANGITERTLLKPGQRLVVPGKGDPTGARTTDHRAVRSKQSVKALAPPRAKPTNSWAKYHRQLRRPGRVTLVRADGKRWSGHVVGPGRAVLPAARGAFKDLLRSKSKATHAIDPRLMRLVVKVSDTFGGRPIWVVSGYRNGKGTSATSRHHHGKAIDFRIEGVPVAVVRDFCKTLDRVGVGFYPNSKFVHLDVRQRWTYWVDYAGPGQPARYGGFWTKQGRVR